MAAPINIPVNAQLQNQTQLERQLQQATQNLRINFATGNSARSLGALSQPLGRLTGQADEFSKSLDAANARVLAFGASVGIVNTLTNAFKSLVNSTIEVEKAITAISVVGDQFAGKNKQLSQGLFSIAKATGQSFQEVSKAALEFSRQGLSLEDTLQRTQNALILTRLTGLDAAKAVDGLTASVNAFSKAGLNTTQIINKLAAVDQAFAVSSADLIEGFNRSAAVAQNAGVTFDELAGIITALQQETSRGGAVIGNALKTIFTRLQDTSTLNQLKNLGVAVQDLQGNLLPARQILQNLATDIEGLGQITKAGVFKDVAGTFQINQLISLVGDLGKENSIAAAATRKAAGATNEAFIANEKLNQSLDAILNKIANAGQQFGSLLGEIGITDGFRELLGYIDSFLEGANKLLQGDDLGSRFAKGLVKGIGSVLTGPGIGIILAVIAKLGVDLAKFGVQSLKTFFGIGQAARDQQKIQESIVQTLIRNQSVLSQILNTQGGQNAQAQTFLNILRQEEQVLQNIRTIAGGIAAPLISQGYRAGAQGIQRRSAGGYLPAQEASDVRRGVGGASPNSKVVAIPNFAFGGGKRGTMIANTSEYIVPNYAGGGSAIFNQDMAKTMGLPPGAKKITASGGFVPNFASSSLDERRGIITYKNFPVSKLSPLELADQADPFDNFSGKIQILQQKKNNNEYNELAQDKARKIITKLSSKGKEIDKKYLNRLIGYFKSEGVDSSSISGLRSAINNATPRNAGFITVQNRIKGILGEIDASKLSGKSLAQGNAYLDLVDGGEVKTRKVTPLRNLIKKVANTYLSKNYIRDNDKKDLVNAPTLPLYIPATDNLKQSIDLKASGGYIPNFANYVYDSDRLGGDKQKILQAILDSTKKKDLLVGPAGAGKSTLGSGLGTFISSIDDISKASSFTILSGAALTKEKGLSQDLRAKLAAVQASGGKVSYLGVTNQELLSRREKRATEGSVEGDLRSAAQLAGSKFAPLNQGAFIRQLKRSSSNFELLRESKQQASTNQQLAILGLYGENGNIDGSPVYTLKSQRPNLFKDIEGNLKKNVTNLVKAYASRIGKKIGIPVGAKDIKKSLTQIPSLSGFMFEDVLNQLAGPNFDTATESSGSRIDFPLTKNLREVFGVTGTQIYAEAKLNPYSGDARKSIKGKQLALARGAQGPVERSGDLISGLKAKYLAYKNLPGRTKGNAENKAIFNQIVNSLDLDPTTPRDTLIKQVERALGAAAEGYIPNFAASALLDAISREKSAGLSASQIYVDQSPSLKSSSNPMGLMVANRRDEPAGGFQGIARARKEGMNPKTYGAARGFVPNYVLPPGGATQSTLYPPNSTTNNSATNTQTNTRTQQTQTRTIQDSIGALVSLQIVSSALTGIFSEASENVQKFGTAVSSAIIGVQGIKELGRTEGGAGFGANFRTNSARSRREIGVGFRLARRGVENFSFGGISKGLGLVTKGLFRFAPLIGQAVLAFDILNSTLKIFGVDLVKIGTDFFRGVNDAGQKARDSITEFATALDEGTGRISGENLFDILQKRANLLIEENKFKAAGIAQPKTEEELAKARETVLRQTSAAAFKELRGGQTIEQNIAKLGERQEQRGRTRVTTTIQTLSGSVRKSAEEAYIEAFSGIERLSDESIKKLAPTLGIKGDNVKELRESILKQVSEDLDQQLKTAKATSSNGEDFVATFRQLANTSIFGRIISRLKATPQQAEAFAKRTEENINSYLISEKDFFDRKNKQFAEAVNLFSSATATKTFSSLDIATQTKKLNALDIGKSQQAFIQQLTDFAAQARQELSTQYQGLALQAGLDTQQSQQIESFIKGFDPSNIQAFNEGLNNLVERLGGVDAEIINKLRSIANNFSGQQEEIISKRGNELKLLQFTIEERNLETKAIQTYNKNIVTFGRSIFDAEQRIQEFNSKLKILDLQKDFDIAISDAFASSGEDSLLKRQEIERTNFEKQAVIQAKIAEEQARIELKRTLVTQENIVALNRNTTALKELLDIQSLAQESELKQIKNNLANEFSTLTGFSIDDFRTDLSPEAKNLQQQYNQISNVLRAITERRAVNSSATGLNASGGLNTGTFKEFTSASVEDLIKNYKSKLTGTETPQQVEAAIESYVQTLGYSEELTIRVRDALITYSRSTESAGVAQSNLRTELEKAQELEKNKNTLLSTYAATIQAQIKAGQDALLVPQTMGEFAAQKRKNELAQEALNISQRGIENPDQLRRDNPEEYRRRVSLNDSAVREFLSSGRYGFEEGLIELEQKTLDFRKELGQEIPRLFSSNLAQGLNDAISGAKSLKDALRDAATSFFQAITQKNIENLANLFTVNLGNTGSSLFKANGGLISGGSGTKDDIPAMLMGGEYVIKKSAVKKYGSGFFDALNKGSVKGFANGGGVQSGTGGFYVPGDYGTGGIRGKRQLLSFATQSFTSGQYDTMGGFGIGGASVSLEAESGRLSQFGRQNNPMFERVQESKQQAFDVYLQQLKQEEQYEEQLKEIEQREKERQKQLVTSIASAVISSLVSVAAKKANIGAENEIAANEVAGKTLTGTERAITGLKGAGKGIFTSQGSALSQDAILMRSVRDTSLQNINFAGSGRNISERPFGLSNSVLRSGNSSFRSSPNLPLPTGGPNIDLSLFGLPNYGSDGFYRPYPKRYNGGYITGGSGMRDDVPAMLTGGEFVLNNRATRKLGVQNLNRLNAGETGGGEDRSGAVTESLLSKLDELIQATRDSSGDNVVVNVSSNEAGGMTESNSGNEKELQRKIRQAVLDVIAQEKRLGGSLNKDK
jgi:TP901 family phage tail tape measure protein